MPSHHISLPALLTILLILPSTLAHVALWHPSMYGWDASDPNQNDAVTPLANMDFKDWWFHGYMGKPPAEGEFLELPSGGTLHAEVACNKALTSYGQNDYQQTGLYACDGSGPSGGIGALHTTDAWQSPSPTDVKGCGLSIAYESDASKLTPSSFAVVSTNWTCPWFKHVDFEIPSGLKACPEGGCHCLWGWIHSEDSGSEQMYHLAYRCNVTGATGTLDIPPAHTANKCDYPTDTSNCTVGPKQMHYWLQNEQNNNLQGYFDPPFYNGDYGFMNGAQTDLFAGLSADTSSAASATSAASSTTTSTPAIVTSTASGSSASVASSSSSSTFSTASSATASYVVVTATITSTVYEDVTKAASPTASASASVSTVSGFAVNSLHGQYTNGTIQGTESNVTIVSGDGSRNGTCRSSSMRRRDGREHRRRTVPRKLKKSRSGHGQ